MSLPRCQFLSLLASTPALAMSPSLAAVDASPGMPHAHGMKVILDWVANHTAFDHPWTHEHTDWYRLDAHGAIFPVTFNACTPHEGHWSDVTQLDYGSRLKTSTLSTFCVNALIERRVVQ
jgi:hypothetical protein